MGVVLYRILWALLCMCITKASLNLECVQTIHDDNDVYNKPISIKRVQGYKPKPSTGDLPIYFDPCVELEDSKFALHWDLKSSDATGNFGSHVILCLTIAHGDFHLTENSTCFNFTILSTEKQGEINCWAELVSYKETLLMKAHATVHDGRQTYQLYSELITSGIDALCKMNHIEKFSLRRVHGCNASGHFNVKPNYEIKAINAKCKHNITQRLAFRMLQNSSVAVFRLAPKMKGRYNLTIVLYHTEQHMYFAISSQIDVICGLETIIIPENPETGTSFPVFAIVTTFVVSFTVIVAIVCVMKFRGHINLVLYRRRDSDQRRPQEMMSLNSGQDPGLNNGCTVSQRHFQPLPTIPSQQSSSQSLSTDTKLALNDLNTYKQIMVLPLSYDPFVRDLVSCLRDVLGIKEKITFKCIYDDQVLEAYDKNKGEWVNGVLDDRNTIVLVLCLTSLSCENRDKTRVDDILDHCKVKVTRRSPLCQIYFVNMTGRDYGLHDYHGKTLIMENQSEIKQVIGRVLVECGFDMDSMLLTEILQSEQFAKLIQKVLSHNSVYPVYPVQ